MACTLRVLSILALTILAKPTPAAAQASNEEIVRDIQEFVVTYVLASTTLRLCSEIGWDFDHDEAELANARRLEALLVQRGMPANQLDRLFDADGFQDRLRRELFDYYRSNGINRFRRTDDILNAVPDQEFNQSTGKNEIVNNAEFCDLARREFQAGSPIGSYFRPL